MSSFAQTTPSRRIPAGHLLALLCVLGTFFQANHKACAQTPRLAVTPYSVLGSQTSIASVSTANVAVDSKDNVYYPNYFTNTIYKIDTQGNQTLIPTSGLNSPQGMRFDASDNLYLCDAFNSRIVVLTPAGVQTVLPITGLLQPQHLAFDSGYQNLYVSDRYAGILQYNLASRTTTLYAANLFRPEGIAVDAQNNVYYGDGGTLLRNRATFSTTVGEPDALLFDPAGNLYVESTDGEGLHRIDPTGTILAMADDGSNDIAIDSHGILYMPSHNGQHMFAYLPGPAVWGGRIDAFVGGRIFYHYANTIRTYYSTPAGVTLTSLTIPAKGSPYGGDNAPACFTSTLCGANMSLGAFLPGPQPGYALATFSDGTRTTTPLYASGLQVEMGFNPGIPTQLLAGIPKYGGAANDLNGNVYVSDVTGNRVLKISGTTVTTVPFTGLNQPTQLAVDGANSVYVFDSGSGSILKLDSTGKQTLAYDPQAPTNAGLSMTSFAVDGATNLYVSGTINVFATEIVSFSPTGVRSVYAYHNYPTYTTAMAFDSFGTLYTNDGYALGRYDHFANYTYLAALPLQPNRIAIEPSGTVYATLIGGGKLMQISPSGTVSAFDIPGLTSPSAVTIDNYGNLTVGDDATHLLTFVDRTTQPFVFGDLTVGASRTLHSSLVNVGSTSGLTITSISADAPFALDASTTTCVPGSTSLPAGASCEIGFSFTPTAVQSYSDTAYVQIPLPTPYYSATVATLALTGNGVKPAPVANPGGPYTGTAGSPVSFNGSASTSPNTQALTYAWSFGDNTAAAGLTPTHTFTAAGTYTVTLTVTDTEGGKASASTTATIAQSYAASLTPSSFNFGSVGVGSSATTIFTLTNTSAVSIAVGTIVLAPESTNSFSYTKTCSATLAVNATCTFTVTFKPTTDGAAATTLNVTDDAGTQKATITGTGLTPTATLTPASYNFGPAGAGTPLTKVFLLTNTSIVALAVDSVQFTPDLGSENTFSTSTDCGQTLAAGASCNITLIFKPLAAGTFSGSLSAKDAAGSQTSAISGISPNILVINVNEAITTTDAISLLLPLVINVSEAITTTDTLSVLPPVLINVSETISTGDVAGTGPVVTISPTNFNFGSVTVGAAPTTTLTLTNLASTSLSVTNVLVIRTAAPNNSGYSILSNCPALLAASASCTATLTFAPTATGIFTASVHFIDGAGTQAVSLAGTAISPTIKLSTTSLEFGAVAQGTQAKRNLTLTNTSPVPVTLLGAAVSANPALNFSAASGCPAVLAVAAACSVSVSFTPSSLGAQSAALTVTGSAGTQVVPLAGVGVLQDFTFTSDVTTSSANHQQDAVFNLTATSNTPALLGTLTFSYQGDLPAGYSQHFSLEFLSSNQGPATGYASQQLRIVYGHNAQLYADPFHRSQLPLPTACLLFGLVALFRKRLHRRVFTLLLCLSLLSGTLGLTGCGSGTTPITGTLSATNGSYTHTIPVKIYITP